MIHKTKGPLKLWGPKLKGLKVPLHPGGSGTVGPKWDEVGSMISTSYNVNLHMIVSGIYEM